MVHVFENTANDKKVIVRADKNLTTNEINNVVKLIIYFFVEKENRKEGYEEVNFEIKCSIISNNHEVIDNVYYELYLDDLNDIIDFCDRHESPCIFIKSYNRTFEQHTVNSTINQIKINTYFD